MDEAHEQGLLRQFYYSRIPFEFLLLPETFNGLQKMVADLYPSEYLLDCTCTLVMRHAFYDGNVSREMLQLNKAKGLQVISMNFYLVL